MASGKLMGLIVGLTLVSCTGERASFMPEADDLTDDQTGTASGEAGTRGDEESDAADNSEDEPTSTVSGNGSDDGAGGTATGHESVSGDASASGPTVPSEAGTCPRGAREGCSTSEPTTEPTASTTTEPTASTTTEPTASTTTEPTASTTTEPTATVAPTGTVPVPSCSSSETQCAGLEFQLCDDGEWARSELCEAGCDDDVGCTAQCAEGDTKCAGTNQIQTCNAATGLWNAATTCTDDGVACTDDVCEVDTCVNKLKAGACLIAGTCYAHNQDDATNECQYCDSISGPNAWTPRGTNVGCDDDTWCNGADNCDGGGACNDHEFPADSRCSGGEVCNDTCNEAQQNCFSPNTTVCDTGVNYQCQAGCGGDVQSSAFTQYCTGSAATCTGATEDADWQTEANCSASQVCSGQACADDFECGCTGSGNFFDSETGLCWQNTPSSLSTMGWSAATTLCENGTWNGFTDWVLPTITEQLTLLRGCQNGVVGDALDLSTCNLSPAGCAPTDDCDSTVACFSCTEGSGPTNGCYWPTGMAGTCGHYWSSSPGPNPLYVWRASYSWGDASRGDVGEAAYYARCVRR